MRLAILAQAYLYDNTVSINGTLVQLHHLAFGFKHAGIEVHYIALTEDKTKPEKSIIDGIHFYWVQIQSRLLLWKKIMPLYYNILIEIQPSVIYVRGRNVLQYVAGVYAKKNNIQYVWGTNGDDSAEFWKNTKRLKLSKKIGIKKLGLYPFKIVEDFFINKGMKMANVIINQSLHQQQETKRILNKNGIVLPSYFFYRKTNMVKKNHILWLASLSPNKQPELFLRLIDTCDLNDWKAILGGGTKNKMYESKIKSLITNKNSVRVLGEVAFKDSFKYYETSKIYINTSKPDADGLPNAYIQSWLSGTVVLSLHHDPNNWMGTHNIGFSAKGDFNALKEKLKRLINEPEMLETMSDNAVKFATKTFTDSTIIQNYIKLFNVPVNER
ncbi:glycosyltransferase family 4 protein [Flavivirga sp. 57AJ16]|uniref:glycosyltransferase family 4 protein n=1 Tax=Flavivirga sp. 57AJ16 TaxID=3025307 RepID=UPI002365904F|nr:glycosyltransferase family 4 protein [Flavivirga sp. 57AJ16]MDD7886237.1 glycosyltransferase family 4 protein [Flavivirga sp. 57AJ16]